MELVAQVRLEPVARAELLGDLARERGVEAATDVDLREPSSSASGCSASSRFSFSMSARSASRCELTETYSPTAIDIAPATSAATPATRIAVGVAEEAATPIIRLAVETIASFDPRTAARSHPARPM